MPSWSVTASSCTPAQRSSWPRLAPLLLCAACTLGSGSGGDDTASGPDDTGEGTEELEPDFSAFDDELEAILAEYDLEGASAAIVHRDLGMVYERAYGTWEVDRQSFIASASKVLSAGVLAHLDDEGLVDLDAPISTYVDDWGERAHDFDPTLAQMLSNSSGMTGLLDNPAYPPYLCMLSDRTTLGACGRSLYTAQDAAVTVAPDTEYHYGGAQWQLAGAIAEEVSGTPWNTLIDELYVEPCELEGLAYGNPYGDYVQELVETRSVAYPADGLVLAPSDNPNIEGGAYTSAGDYGRLLQMHLRGGACPGGRVLSEAAVARMQEDRILEWGGEASLGPVEYSLEGYGLGWWHDRDQPGLIADPGVWSATPWLDLNRGYGVMVQVEGGGEVADAFLQRLVPLAGAAFDEADAAPR